MLDLKDDIWYKQIGDKEKGFDFSGREIHKDQFQNYDSPYGWTYLEFDADDYLVVNVATEPEMPTDFLDDGTTEFVVNDKLFNITKNNENNEWDINSIEYKKEYIPPKKEYIPPKQKNKKVVSEQVIQINKDDEDEYVFDEEDDEPEYSYSSDEEYDLKDQDNYEQENLKYDDQFNNSQEQELRRLEALLEKEKQKQKELESSKRRMFARNSRKMNERKFNQQREISQLENQLEQAKQRAQQIQIENNRRRVNELKQEIARTQQLNLSSLNSYQDDHYSTYSNDMMNLTSPISYNDASNYHFRNTQTIPHNYNNSGNSLISSIAKKIEEQTVQIEALKLDQKVNERKIEDLKKQKEKQWLEKEKQKVIEEKVKIEKQQLELERQQKILQEKTMQENKKQKPEYKIYEPIPVHQYEPVLMPRYDEPAPQISKGKNLSDDKQAQKVWAFNFGENTLGSDFAGFVVIKDKFGLDEEGGWDIDYYDENSFDVFLASTKLINTRAGRKIFDVNNIEYKITNINNKWEILKSAPGQRVEYTAQNFESIAANLTPNEEKFLNGNNYETYSSLLINLNHFPLIQLDKFEEFLKTSLSHLPFYKELYIYSNERLYKNQESNISAYARVFFKSSSTKDDVDILLLSLSLKKGVKAFVNRFRSTNDLDEISFSMVLMSHQKHLKFVHAQTNFELLRAHPIPLKIPFDRLILDKEYNSILKFHENNLWKQLKPFALDWNGNVYYVCDVDADILAYKSR